MGAAIAFVLPHLDRLSVLATAYHQEANGWFALTPGSYIARVAIAVVLLTPITLLMGGTLTLLIRYLVRAEPQAETRRIALLYAVNTAGAAAGAFLTDFALVPAGGLLATQLLAVALNAVAGVGAIRWGRRKAAPVEIKRPDAGRGRERKRRSSPARIRPEPIGSVGLQADLPEASVGVRLQADLPLVALALALSGFAGLGMEILWFRHFSIMLGAFRAVFSLLLTVILVGIGAGSLVASALLQSAASPHVPTPWAKAGRWLLIAQSLFVVTTLAGMALADSSVIDVTVSNDPAFRAAVGRAGDAVVTQQGAAWNVKEVWFNLRPMLPEVLLPALLIGFSFPLGNALVQRTELAVGRRAGAFRPLHE